MDRLSTILKPWGVAAARVGLVGLLLAGVTGCDKDDRDGPTAASSTQAVARPEALSQARQDIKNGDGAGAQQRVEAFLKEDPRTPFRAEAEYLLGQALSTQGDFANGKAHLEVAIDEAQDRDLKAFAMLGRANCNMEMKSYHLASRQYHWLETMYRDVKGLPQDEIMFKLGLSSKRAGAIETADYWFSRVIELYATGPYAEDAKRENSKYSPTNPKDKPLVYSLEFKNYGDEKTASEEAEVLRAKGYRDVEVVPTSRNSIPTWEVHIGKFFNKNDAQLAKTDADLAGLNTTIRPAIIEPMK